MSSGGIFLGATRWFALGNCWGVNSFGTGAVGGSSRPRRIRWWMTRRATRFHGPHRARFVARSEPGTVYVYLNYGMYWLLNFLVKEGSEDGFVLVRALEPTVGVERMSERRGGVPERKLCAGPGRLGVALGLGRESHGVDGCGEGPVRLNASTDPVEALSGPRIGISRSVDLPWRFVVAGSGCLSAPLRIRQA